MPMSKKIAFFLPSMVDGGAERVTLNLIRYLAQHYDYTIDLVLVSATGAFMGLVPDNVRVIDLKGNRTLTSAIDLVRYLRNERPHALFSGMAYVNVIALAAVKISRVQVRTVACLHNTMSAQLANTKVFRGRFIVPFVKLTHPWADVVVAISRGCGEDFLKVTGVSGENMRYIYNSVITDDIEPLASQPADHPWFSDSAVPVILSVGRFVHQKNFPLLINAFAKVRETHAARLLILGDGEDREDLESQILKLDLQNDVDMPGFVSNPYSYMRNSAIFVLSSHYEALPTVLIEAMYCGPELVATDCPSGPREILADGKYGTLVPVEDTEALASAIINALDRPAFKQDPRACDPFIDHNVIGQYLDAIIGDGESERRTEVRDTPV